MNLVSNPGPRGRSHVVGGALLASALIFGLPPLAAATADTVPGAPWVRQASAAQLEPLKPGIRRPEVLLYSDSYAYGAATPFGSNPRFSVTVAPNSVTTAVTLYVYWVNRADDQVRYYNLVQGWVAQEVDLFGQGSGPVRVLVPELEDFDLIGAGGALGPLSGVPTTTGRYMLVFEVRDSEGSEVLARDYALYNFVDGLVSVGGDLASNQTWTNNNVYFIDGPLFVTAGRTLTIEAGTVVLGGQANGGLLGVRQDGTLIAVGTADDPIIFTSERVRDERGTGDWGGIIMNGRAPVNNAEGGAFPLGEGNSGPYGGNNAADSSGRVEYVRIEFAGIRFTDENELNGIALQGVGTGTVLENIQVIGGADDGIEFFGGTADITNAIVVNVEDDSFDWTFGWNGTATNICLLQTTEGNGRDKLIEADGNEQDPSATPLSDPTMVNLLAWRGYPADNDGVQFRRGTHVTLRNAVIGGVQGFAIRVDGQESQQAVVDGGISFEDVIVQNVGTVANVAVTGVTEENARIANVASRIHPDLTPLSGSAGCTTRANDWTQLPWVNWDRGANN